jgi:hypothetical protein
VIVVAILLILPSLLALLLGRWDYIDYRGLLVFAPGMILSGLVMIVFALRVGKR